MVAERLIISLLALIIGFLFCFLGYRLFRMIMAIWGFLLGFLVGAQFVLSLLGSSTLATTLAWVTGVVLGLVLATLAYALYTAALTLLGASIGYMLGVGLMEVLGLGNQTILVVIIGLILAVLFAILILALDLARLFIIANTAMGGAASLILGLLWFFNLIPISLLDTKQLSMLIRQSPPWLLGWLAIAVMGGIFQSQHTRRYKLERYAFARKVTQSGPPGQYS
jgi:hypothetical protein